MYFENQSDYDKYTSSNNQSKVLSSTDVVARSGYTYKSEVIESKYVPMLWIGYHSKTPDWSQADHYTAYTNVTYSADGSYEYKGFTLNLGFSYSSGIEISYPADPARWSRLGCYGDFTFQYIKLTEM